MLPAVARWGATFYSVRGIGEGGTAFPRESWSRGGGPCVPTICGRCAPRPGVCAGLVAPAATDARGAAPREQVVRLGSSLPEVGAGGPHTPMRGRSAPPPRVTFPSRGKSPKARQGLRPLESPEGERVKSETLFAPAPPAASRNPLDRVSTIKQDRFATLSEWASRPYFSPQATPGVTPSAVNPWRGRGCLRGCLRV